MMQNAQHETYPILPVYQAISGRAIAAREGYSIPAKCPLHNDHHASLSLDTIRQRWYCHACCVGGDAVELAVRAFAFGSNPYREAFAYVRQVLRIPTPAQYRPATSTSIPTRIPPRTIASDRKPPKEAEEPFRLLRTIRYPFTDAQGRTLYEEVRREGVNPTTGEDSKRIILQRVIPEDATWVQQDTHWELVAADGSPIPCGPDHSAPIVLPLKTRDGRDLWPHKMRRLNNVTGIERVLFDLPNVLATARSGGVLGYTEGPKKAAYAATALDMKVTTLAGGAGAQFSSKHAACFDGACLVLVFADADPKGRLYAQNVATAITARGTAAVVVDLYPGEDNKLDIYNWLAARPHHDPQTLRRLLKPFTSQPSPGRL